MYNLDYHQNLKHSNIEILNIDKVCRICLNERNDIFSILDNGLIDLLTQCTTIKITNEDGVFSICTDCGNAIKQCHVFFQHVLNSQKIGRYLMKKKYLNKAENEVMKEKVDNNDKSNTKLYCSICMKGFGTKSLLNIHIKTHDELKHYSCSVCDKKYNTEERLTEHTRNHTGVRPYTCAECPKTFTRKLLLGLHVRNVMLLNIILLDFNNNIKILEELITLKKYF